MRSVKGLRYGRYLRVVAAVGAASSLAGLAAVGCANGGGDNETLIEAGNDGSNPADTGKDVTVIVPHDASKDGGRDVSNDFIIIPFPEGSTDGPGFLDTKPPGDGAFSFDAGPSFFGPPGSQCATLGATQVQACGRCGSQTSTCVLAPDGAVLVVPDTGAPEAGAADATLPDAAADAGKTGDAGPVHDAGPGHDAGHDAGGALLIWGPFSACTGENDAGCVPGTTTTTTCGLCGTQMTVCEPDCELGATNCTGEILDGCAPGSVDFQPSAACGGGSLEGMQRTCNSTCAWDASTACTLPPTSLIISPTVAGKVGTFVDFVATQEQGILTLTSCPSSASAVTSTPFAFITLTNPSTTLHATVSVWTSQSAGAPAIATAITSYLTQPANMAGLAACVGLVTDTCTDMSDPTSCQGTYGGLMIGDFSAVTIDPGASIVILVQDQFSDPADLGVIAVTARTESFQ
jgi:hypothetical protein